VSSDNGAEGSSGGLDGLLDVLGRVRGAQESARSGSLDMPRLSGPEVLRATGIGTPYDHVPKIVWSTSQRQIDIDECLRLGATRFAIKPESGAQLDNLIRSLGCYITPQNNLIFD